MNARWVVYGVCGFAVLAVVVVRCAIDKTPRDADLSNARDVEALARLHKAHDEVLDQLLDGRISLMEAGARFREQNDVLSPHGSAHRLFAGASEDEQACRQVISWARARETDEERAAALAGRLEAELQAWLEEVPTSPGYGDGGTVRCGVEH
jgi:hypothetical protein